jgi:hypothetical protein
MITMTITDRQMRLTPPINFDILLDSRLAATETVSAASLLNIIITIIKAYYGTMGCLQLIT